MSIDDPTYQVTVPNLLDALARSQAEKEMRKLVLSTLARGSLTELRTIIDNCDDHDTARNIYGELRRLSYRVARAFNFDTAPDARNKLIVDTKPGRYPAPI